MYVITSLSTSTFSAPVVGLLWSDSVDELVNLISRRQHVGRTKICQQRTTRVLSPPHWAQIMRFWRAERLQDDATLFKMDHLNPHLLIATVIIWATYLRQRLSGKTGPLEALQGTVS